MSAAIYGGGPLSKEQFSGGLGKVPKVALVAARQADLTAELRRRRKAAKEETLTYKARRRKDLCSGPVRPCSSKWWKSMYQWFVLLLTDKYFWIGLRTNAHDLVYNPGRSWKGYFWNIFVCIFVFISATTLILETMTVLHRRDAAVYDVLNGVCQFVFLVELFLRLLTADSFACVFQNMNNWVDFLATWSVFVWYSIGSRDFDFLMIFRLIRSYRFMWFVRFGFGGTLTFWRLLYQRTAASAAMPLLIMVMVYLATIVIFACIMFYSERGDWNSDQREYFLDGETNGFSSIPATCWWAVVTLGQLGYGDMVPLTTQGKFWTCLGSFTGVLVFTIPITIISATFRREHTVVVLTVEKVQALFRGFNHRVKSIRYRRALQSIVRMTLFSMARSKSRLRYTLYSLGIREAEYGNVRDYSADMARSGRAPVTLHDYKRAAQAVPEDKRHKLDPYVFFELMADDHDNPHDIMPYAQVNKMLDSYWETMDGCIDEMMDVASLEHTLLAEKLMEMHVSNMEYIETIKEMTFMECVKSNLVDLERKQSVNGSLANELMINKMRVHSFGGMSNISKCTEGNQSDGDNAQDRQESHLSSMPPPFSGYSQDDEQSSGEDGIDPAVLNGSFDETFKQSRQVSFDVHELKAKLPAKSFTNSFEVQGNDIVVEGSAAKYVVGQSLLREAIHKMESQDMQEDDRLHTGARSADGTWSNDGSDDDAGLGGAIAGVSIVRKDTSTSDDE